MIVICVIIPYNDLRYLINKSDISKQKQFIQHVFYSNIYVDELSGLLSSGGNM